MSYDDEELKSGIFDMFSDQPARYPYDFGELNGTRYLKTREATDEELLEEARNAKPLPKIHPSLDEEQRWDGALRRLHYNKKQRETYRRESVQIRVFRNKWIAELEQMKAAIPAPLPAPPSISSWYYSCSLCSAKNQSHRCPGLEKTG